MLRGSILIGIMIAPVAMIVWVVAFVHSPDLQRAVAAQIISSTPEFNDRRSLVGVSTTTRGADSLKDCCYDAEFVFTERGSTTPVKARAEFRYWNHSGHLQNFAYGRPHNAQTIWINSDVPPNGGFSK